MNFDRFRVRNSSPQLKVSYNIVWLSLDHAFGYGVVLACNVRILLSKYKWAYLIRTILIPSHTSFIT